EGQAQVVGLPGREGGADVATLGDAVAAGGADFVGAGKGAWRDGLVGSSAAAEDVNVPAGLVAYPQRVGGHAGYVMP
ncbi:hypothetical protein V493_07701, partial [Pseudogymnoascus sp. VKM F-4281 (FW-2241)]